MVSITGPVKAFEAFAISRIPGAKNCRDYNPSCEKYVVAGMLSARAARRRNVTDSVVKQARYLNRLSSSTNIRGLQISWVF